MILLAVLFEFNCCIGKSFQFSEVLVAERKIEGLNCHCRRRLLRGIIGRKDCIPHGSADGQTAFSRKIHWLRLASPLFAQDAHFLTTWPWSKHCFTFTGRCCRCNVEAKENIKAGIVLQMRADAAFLFQDLNYSLPSLYWLLTKGMINPAKNPYFRRDEILAGCSHQPESPKP